MPTPSSALRPARWKILAAFAVIYLVWGSTFLAIRIGVDQVPPLLFAAMRFLTAGVLLTGYTLTRGDPLPTRRQWLSASLLATLIFVCNYGLLFWAEKRVPSGLAAVMLATIPAFTALSEIILLRTQKLTFRLALALLAGIAGVAVLMTHTLHLGSAPIDRIGALALLASALAWSIASALSRMLPLPASKPMSSGTQMLLGGLFLTAASASFGEFRQLHLAAITPAAWLALLYLIVFGSILAFTTFIWLMHHESPTRVGTYAYVNPLVAVLLGFFFGGEALGSRTVFGSVFILLGVIVITTMPRPAAPPAPTQLSEAPEAG